MRSGEWWKIREWLENALEDLPPQAETLLISLLDNPDLQRVVERFIDGLPEEFKNLLGERVQHAIDQISSSALQDTLTEFAGNVGIELTPDLGVPAVADHFVFNTEPHTTNAIDGLEGFWSSAGLTHFVQCEDLFTQAAITQENVLEDLPAQAEARLLNILDNPDLQRVAERVIDGLPEEVQGLLGDLVQHAIDQISSPALKEKLTEFAQSVGIDLTPNFIDQNSTTAEAFTPGVLDQFVFNAEQQNTNLETIDTNVGFEGLCDPGIGATVFGAIEFADLQLGSTAPMSLPDYFFT